MAHLQTWSSDGFEPLLLTSRARDRLAPLSGRMFFYASMCLQEWCPAGVRERTRSSPPRLASGSESSDDLMMQAPQRPVITLTFIDRPEHSEWPLGSSSSTTGFTRMIIDKGHLIGTLSNTRLSILIYVSRQQPKSAITAIRTASGNWRRIRLRQQPHLKSS